MPRVLIMKSGGTLSSNKAKEMLRDGTAHGKKLTKKQKGYFGLIAGGGTPKAGKGGMISPEGEMTILDKDTVEFTGDQHNDPSGSGGQPIRYAEHDLLVEGGETGYISPVDKSLTVFTKQNDEDSKNPLTGNSYSKDSQALAKNERKMDELGSLGLKLMQNNDPFDPFGGLAFKAGMVMASGANMKKKEIATSKEHLKSLQQASIQLRQESEGMAQFGQAKNGVIIAQSGATAAASKYKKWLDLKAQKDREESRGIILPDGRKVTYKKWMEIKKQEKTSTTTTPVPPNQTTTPVAQPETTTQPSMGTTPEGIEGEYSQQIRDAAAKYGVDPSVVEKLVFQESGSNPNAKSDRNARGVMQFMEGTAKMYGITPNQLNSSNPLDIQAVIDAGVHHLSDLLKQFKGDYKLALMAYNGGPGALTGTKDFEGYFKKASRELGKPIDQLTGDDIMEVMEREKVKNPTSDKHAYRNEMYDYVKTITGSGENFKKFATGYRNKYYSKTDPYNPPEITWKDIDTPPPEAPVKNAPPKSNFNFQNPSPRPSPSPDEPLGLTQILPELYGIASNRTEPVFMQKFQPELYEPYQVSFQDKLNENQATFSALSKASAYNPSALATLAGQKYSADSGVLAEEFRTNQGIANDITNKNIQLLNSAQEKNLSLADIQYGRQSTAKSNTKAINHQALNSISSKILQNERDNNLRQVWENMYDYRYDKNDNMKLNRVGASGAESVNWPGNDNNGLSPYQSTSEGYDRYGNPTGKTISTPSLIDQQRKQYAYEKQTGIYPKINSASFSHSKLFNKMRNKNPWDY